ncbi:unnamed protein product [Didymodactylos carnosus]|uniref:Uncharacterized protein n=1 Tax=Didymodactylos carnosus TaxID=1234261 RepID=A0A815KIE0_9BILA|nr:unnamed protein product [Didymodactylos carnosus]CAF4286040.1 unnamed protein product [Didymodactylos carnosus]
MKQPLRLRRVVITALAVRKFQKFESDRFKQSIECEFDKTVAINELKRSHEQDKSFDLKESKKFAYYIRKFTLTFDELKYVHTDLLSQLNKYLNGLSSNFDEQVHYFLCLSLKYLTQNSKQLKEEIQYSLVIDLIKRCNNESIKTELVYTLAYMTEKLTLNNELIDELSSLVLNKFDINEEAKGLLLAQLEISKSLHGNDQLKTEYRFISTGKSNGNQKMNKLVVTKTIQTVKSTFNNKESEEAKMIFMNLSDALKNRNRTLNMKTTLEKIETIDDTSGDDRSMWRSTWAESLNLYTLVVSQGQTLKSDDKDYYLPEKLFGSHFCFNTNIFSGGIISTNRKQKVYSFFINRMIAATLLRASKKQQLNSDAIDKLMMCVTDFDSFVSIALHCNENMLDLFVNAMHDDYDEFKELTQPDLVTIFIKRIIDKTIEIVIHKGWLWNSTEKENNSINLNVIYNCSIRNKQVLTKNRIKKIQQYLTDYQENDAKFTKTIFQLMHIADSTNNSDYKTTFNTYINVLVRGTRANNEMIISFINNQAKDAKRSKELFTDKILEKLINLLNSDDYDTKIKEDIVEIINTYLEHETNKALKDKHLELLIQYILDPSNSSDNLINSVLTSILIIAEKQSLLSNRIVKILIDNMKCFGENSSNYILLILSRVIHERNSLDDEQDLEKISFKLESNDVVQLNDDSKIIFTQRSKQNQHGNQISLLTANLIFLFIQKEILITNKTIENLILALNNDDKQTKIISSKCIYKLSKYIMLENDTLSQMKDFVNDQIYDVSIYILAAYSCGLMFLSVFDQPINAMHMDNLSSLFLTQNLRLGEIGTNKILQNSADNLYMSINVRRRYNSFKFLEKARQNQDLPEGIFYKIELVKAAFVLSRSLNKKSIMKFLEEQTNNGIHLPIDTVIALEKEIYNEDALRILYNISKNKQIIQYDLLNKLINIFNPNSDQFILINIFENVAKNNQTLSIELLKKLEIALNRKTIEDKVLSIFIYLAQKELLSALGSLIQTHHINIKQYQQQIEEILENGIRSDNIHLQKMCIHVLKLLAQFITINSNLFDIIIKIGISFDCDRIIKDEIYSLFTFMEQNSHNNQLTNKYKAKIQLANLNYQSNSELLNQLKTYANYEDGLLEQNYCQLKNIIDQDLQLQENTLEILHLSKSKNQMTNDLIESIVLLYESTNSQVIMNSCSKLLEDVNCSGKNLNNRVMKIVYEKQRNDKANEIKQAFSQNNLYKQLQVQFQFNDEQINELIKMSIKSDPFYYNNQQFVLLIEQILLTNTCDEITLQCYCRIIKEQKCQKAEEILDKLVQTTNETSLLLLLIESIYYSLKYCHLSDNCFIFLENNLDHDDRLIQSFAFKGFKNNS